MNDFKNNFDDLQLEQELDFADGFQGVQKIALDQEDDVAVQEENNLEGSQIKATLPKENISLKSGNKPKKVFKSKLQLKSQLKGSGE